MIIEKIARLTPALVITGVLIFCLSLQALLGEERFGPVSLVMTQISLAIFGISCAFIAWRLKQQHGTSVLAHRIQIFFALLAGVALGFIALYVTSFLDDIGVVGDTEFERDLMRNAVIAVLWGAAVKSMRVASSVVHDQDLEEERISDGRLRR